MILIYSTNTGNLCLTSNDPSAVSGVYKQLMLLIRVSNESSPSVRLDTVVIILILLFWIFCLKHWDTVPSASMLDRHALCGKHIHDDNDGDDDGDGDDDDDDNANANDNDDDDII